MKMTQRARMTVTAAHAAAATAGAALVTSGHLLDALIGDPHATAARALRAVGIDEPSASAASSRACASSSSHHVAFDSQAKQAMEYALIEARELGHDTISTGHILLGLLGDSENPAVARLSPQHLATNRLRELTIALIERKE